MASLRDDILSRLDIVDLVSKYVSLKKVGKNYSGLCPFHREKTPSFTVAEDKQIFKCFGCGKGGNAITFHMEIERLDFWESIQELAKITNVDISDYQHDPEKSKEEKSEKEKFKLLNKRMQGLFKQAFSGSKAEEYCENKRKLTTKTIETFGLGFAPDSHYETVNYLKDKGFSSGDLTKGGVAKQGNRGDVYAFFRNRLTFPIHNHIGTIVGFGARALDPDQNPKYLNTTETPLYDKSRILYGLDKAKKHIKEHGALIIVEGYMDVIALHQYGLPIGIATCGTALTAEHIKLIKRNTDSLLFAFDNDSAGFEATMRGLKIAYTHDLFPRVLQLPEGTKDIDEFLTNSGEHITYDTLNTMSNEGFSAVLHKLQKDYDLQNPVLRKKCIEQLFDLLRNVQDYSIFMMYMETIASAFRTNTQALIKQFKQFINTKKIPKYQTTTQTKEPSDGAIVVGSLLYDNYLSNNALMNDAIQQHITSLNTIVSYLPGESIHTIMLGTPDQQQKQALLEQQLLREKQRADATPTKIQEAILVFLKKTLHEYKRAILKHPSITPQQKAEIMKL